MADALRVLKYVLERTKIAISDGVAHILHKDIAEVAVKADEAASVFKNQDHDSAKPLSTNDFVNSTTYFVSEADSSFGHGASGGRLTATEIRRLVPDEWYVNRDFWLKHVERHPLDFRSTRSAVEKTEQQYREDFATIENFVAFHGNEPIGRVRLVAGENPQFREMAAVIVDPAARGTGTSDRLIQTALMWAKNNNCAAIILWVRNNNEHAKKLYIRHGFAFTGQSRPHFDPSMTEISFVEMKYELS